MPGRAVTRRAVVTIGLVWGLLAGAAGATHPFPDVPTWVDSAVSWADANRYLAGYPDQTFRPDDPMTRAQYARFVHRIAGSPSVEGLDDHGFIDVPPWIDDAVTWLASERLVSGYPDNTFRPDQRVNRGEAARIIHVLAGGPTGVTPHGLDDVPAWLENAVTWITDDPAGPALPLMTGFPDNRFRPGSDISRAQAARLLFRYSTADAPDLDVSVLASGLNVPWGLAELPDGRLLFNERRGGMSLRETNGDVHAVRGDLSDVFATGETGLMGIVIDPDFATNRHFYQCQGHDGPSIQVIKWRMAAAGDVAVRVADPLVAGLPASSGRHGGCRLRFGPDGQLWIATGDAAIGTTPQDLTSLGGKVLRVDPATGEGSPGNPFIASTNANTRRIYTYGHRNLQGLALRPNTTQMWSVEHGPNRDDEVNLLAVGGNSGWNPVSGYNESVPMTDLVAFPDAMEARWSSGVPTVATGGAMFVNGDPWAGYDGALAVATLKNSSLRMFHFTADGDYTGQDVPPALDGTFGRLRSVERGGDGALYITTANGGQADRILRVVPVDN